MNKLTDRPSIATRPVCRDWTVAATRGPIGHGLIIRRAGPCRAEPGPTVCATTIPIFFASLIHFLPSRKFKRHRSSPIAPTRLRFLHGLPRRRLLRKVVLDVASSSPAVVLQPLGSWPCKWARWPGHGRSTWGQMSTLTGRRGTGRNKYVFLLLVLLAFYRM